MDWFINTLVNFYEGHLYQLLKVKLAITWWKIILLLSFCYYYHCSWWNVSRKAINEHRNYIEKNLKWKLKSFSLRMLFPQMSSWFFFHVFQMYPQKSFRRSSFIKWAISSFSPDEAHLVLNTILGLSTAISPLWELPRAEKSHLTRDSWQPLSGHCRSIKTWHSFAPTQHYSKGPSWLPRGLAEASLCPL